MLEWMKRHELSFWKIVYGTAMAAVVLWLPSVTAEQAEVGPDGVEGVVGRYVRATVTLKERRLAFESIQGKLQIALAEHQREARLRSWAGTWLSAKEELESAEREVRESERYLANAARVAP